MSVQIIPASQQVKGSFDGGKIKENKPVGFPHEGGSSAPFGTLFYWADAWSDEGGLIDLHPHKGFEIMSYVIEGAIEHYDTQLRKWIRLEAGSVQIIRSGSGIAHAERLLTGSRIFQIWFDPNLGQSLQKPASYDDFSIDKFPSINQNGQPTTILRGEGSPLEMDSPMTMERIDFKTGQVTLSAPSDQIMGAVLMEGKLELNDQSIEKGDFIKYSGEEEIQFEVVDAGSIFYICVPVNAPYPTYAGPN